VSIGAMNVHAAILAENLFDRSDDWFNRWRGSVNGWHTAVDSAAFHRCRFPQSAGKVQDEDYPFGSSCPLTRLPRKRPGPISCRGGSEKKCVSETTSTTRVVRNGPQTRSVTVDSEPFVRFPNKRGALHRYARPAQSNEIPVQARNSPAPPTRIQDRPRKPLARSACHRPRRPRGACPRSSDR